MEWAKALTTTTTSTCNNESNDREIEGEGLMMAMGGDGLGAYPVRVMTDEQMEVLRQQIGMYAEICEQLIEMHKSMTAHGDTIAGMRLGSIYCDPLMMSGGIPKISARQRWTPTPMQLQILESLFEQGNGTPNKQRIKEITSDLIQHGQISETNVYNWFQNRRARSKRKQTTSSTHQPTEAEAEAEAKGKLEKTDLLRSLETFSEMNSLHPEIKRSSGMSYHSNDSSKSSGSIGQLAFYEHGINRATEDMGFSSFQPGNRYSLNG